MKRTNLLLSIWVCCVSLFTAANASEITKDTVPRRFGVGIAYGFKDRVKGMVHPIELTVRYKLSDRHSLYMNAPFGWMGQKDTRWHWGEVFPPHSYWHTDTDKMRLYGLGFGYDYSIVRCHNLELFAGVGVEYQRLYVRYQTISEGETLPYRHYRYNDYSAYPKIGLRYTWRFVGAELDYRCYFSERNKYTMLFGEYSKEEDYDIQIDHSLRIGIYFLF